MKMARDQASSDHHHHSTDDEEYIDMEVSSSSSSNFFCYSISSSPPQTREFEFQMSSVSDHDKESTTSPADELFYKGTLLPLHLPPRLQMVNEILQTSTTKLDNKTQQAIEQSFHFPFTKTSRTAPCTNTSTPMDQSCNISPSESCRVSSELNADDYVSEWTEDMSVLIGDDHSKKSNWSTKLKQLKQIKQSILSQKLKASRAYVKSLFGKSTCADHHEYSSAQSASNAEPENGSKGTMDCLSKYMKMAKKNPFGKIDNGRYRISSTTLMKSIEKEMAEEKANTNHRKSFSGAFQQHSVVPKSLCSSTSSSVSSSSSSSFSFSSSGFCDLQLLKRSISANSEIESSIEGAIAHCKQSHQLVGAKRQFVGVKRHQDLLNSTSKAMSETHMTAL